LEFQRPLSKALLISLVDMLRGKALRATPNKVASGRGWASATQAHASNAITAMSIVRLILPNDQAETPTKEP
jgi:hypothetical protein